MGALPAGLKALLVAKTPGDYYVLAWTGPDAVTRYWSDTPITSTSLGPIQARVKQWGAIDRVCSDNKNRPDLGQGTQLTIADNDRTFATLLATYGAEAMRGSSATIYLAHKDLSGTANWSPRFVGRLVRWPSEEPLSFTLNLERDNAAVNAYIPKQPIASGDRPNADPKVLHEPIPLLYGLHLSDDTGNKGSVPCALVDDPADLHIVQAGAPSRLVEVFKAGVSQGSGYSLVTSVLSGRQQSHLDFTADTGTNQIAIDVIGVRLGTVQGVANPAGAEERNGASQLKHILVNHAFNDWRNGAFFADSSAPIDTASWAAARSYLDARVPPSGMQAARWIGKRTRVVDLMAEWALNFEMRLYVTASGLWACKALDFAEVDNYTLDPLLTPRDVDALVTEPDDSFLVSSVLVRNGWNEASGSFTEGITVEDARQVASGYLGSVVDEVGQTWNTQAGPGDGIAFARDLGSRRLWLYGRTRTRVSFEAPLWALDAELLSRVWLSHFAGPDLAGQGSSRRSWEARELLVLAISEDPGRRRVKVTCLDLRSLRLMLWDALWVRQQPGTNADGIPRMYVGRRCFTRISKKWVRRPAPAADLGTQFYELAASDPSNSTNSPIVEPIDRDGTLIEGSRTNYVNNSYNGTGSGGQGNVADAAVIFDPAVTPTSALITSFHPTPAAYREYSSVAMGTPARSVVSAWRRIGKPAPLANDPSDLTNTTLFLLADDLAGADGTSIEYWYNRLISTNPGTGFRQATAANQPKVYNNVLGGRRALRFDATNDYMDAIGGLDLSLVINAGGNNGTIIVVYRPANASNAGHASPHENDGIFVTTRAGLALKQNGANTDMLAYASDGASKVATKATIGIGSAHIGIWTIAGSLATTQTLYGGLDEYKCSTFASVACGTITPLTDVPRIGAGVSALNFFDGDILAIMTWSRALYLHERYQVLQWINSYYGIAIPSWTELALKYSLQRSSPDTKWWRSSDQSWQVAETKNAFPTLDGSLNGVVGLCGDVIDSSSGLGTPTLRIYLDDEGHARAHIFHAQLEATS